MKRNFIAWIILASCVPLFAWSNAATIDLPGGKTGFFAGERITIPVAITTQGHHSLRLAWSLHTSGLVTARREITMQAQPGSTTHLLELELPETRDGISIEGLLRLRLTDQQGNQLDETKTPLHIFDPNPFAHREEWLKQLRLHVYDPEETTIKTLENMDIPFQEIRNPEAFDSAKDGILIIGEGISLRESHGLMHAVFKAVQAGVSVIMLSPVDGGIPIPGTEENSHFSNPSRFHLSFHTTDIIKELDKRLDSVNWREGEESVLRYFHIGSHRNRVKMVITERQGWPWVSLDRPTGPKVRFCGFAIMRDWDVSPAPRYLLLAILESMQLSHTDAGIEVL